MSSSCRWTLLCAGLVCFLSPLHAYAIPIVPDTFDDATTMNWFMPDVTPVLPPDLRTGDPPDDTNVAQVSEPATMLLVSTGCAALFAYRRRQQKRRR